MGDSLLMYRILAYTPDRYTAAGGPITSAATDHARAACPAD